MSLISFLYCMTFGLVNNLPTKFNSFNQRSIQLDSTLTNGMHLRWVIKIFFFMISSVFLFASLKFWTDVKASLQPADSPQLMLICNSWECCCAQIKLSSVRFYYCYFFPRYTLMLTVRATTTDNSTWLTMTDFNDM